MRIQAAMLHSIVKVERLQLKTKNQPVKWCITSQISTSGSSLWEKLITCLSTIISVLYSQGQFVGVMGKVGSGKSSLLSAITAEMRKAFGKVKGCYLSICEVFFYVILFR